MIHLRARTLRRYGNGHVRPIGVVGIRDPAVEAERRDPKTVSRNHKQRLMSALIEQPPGVEISALAELLGLTENRTYTFLDELRCEGLVDRLGRLWIAQV